MEKYFVIFGLIHEVVRLSRCIKNSIVDIVSDLPTVALKYPLREPVNVTYLSFLSCSLNSVSPRC